MSAAPGDHGVTHAEALGRVREILSGNAELAKRGLVATESEQLLIWALREAGGGNPGRTDLFTRSKDPLPAGVLEPLIEAAGKRARGSLLQHLTGYQTFLDHDYDVNPSVLVPRPETEVLVTLLSGEIRHRGGAFKGLEVGLGSGIISVELLSRHPGLRMTATELTDGAAATALGNARRILGEGAERLTVLRPLAPLEVLDAFGPPGGDAAFIVSNPPYLTESDPVEDEVVSHEPHEALFSPDAGGLHFYDALASGAGPFLEKGGTVWVEIPAFRSKEIREVFTKRGWQVKIEKDLNGLDRVIRAAKEE